ncbi:unnamed protein product [Anisakis simplex]|uniref:NNMT/PNMT/TEMT family protein n=1 Tax=Anisakis simplex TaxID=6269 RepID=A0A0M3K095_ANISI|nr:unnamed protein product [Anisakis simplex]
MGDYNPHYYRILFMYNQQTATSCPTIYVPLIFRHRSKHIYSSDYAQINRDMLRDWILNKCSFNWINICEHIASIESTSQSAYEMQQQARNKMRAVLKVDVHSDEVIQGVSFRVNNNESVPEQFQVVVSNFCLEYTCETFDGYREAVRGAVSLIEPNGYLIQGGVLNAKEYSFGRRRFKCHSLSKQQLVHALKVIIAQQQPSYGLSLKRLALPLKMEKERCEAVLHSPDDYETHFDPEQYLAHFFSRKALSDGTRLSLFALPTFARMIECEMAEDERMSLCDIGSGPTIYSAICFRSCVKSITLTDYLAKNLDCIDEWMAGNENAFDWTPLISIVTRTEGECPVSEKDISEIESKARSLIRSGGTYQADITQAFLSNKHFMQKQFDIIVSVFCLESATTDYQTYCQSMSNMLELLRPGGRLILGSVVEDDRYMSDDSTMFSLLSLTEDEISFAAQQGTWM